MAQTNPQGSFSKEYFGKNFSFDFKNSRYNELFSSSLQSLLYRDSTAICADVVYLNLEKSCPHLPFFVPIKDFFDVYNVEYLKTSEILKVSSHFDICSFFSN